MRGKLEALFMGQSYLCADRLTTLKSYLLMQPPLILAEMSMGVERSTHILTLDVRKQRHCEPKCKSCGRMQVIFRYLISLSAPQGATS